MVKLFWKIYKRNLVFKKRIHRGFQSKFSWNINFWVNISWGCIIISITIKNMNKWNNTEKKLIILIKSVGTYYFVVEYREIQKQMLI